MQVTSLFHEFSFVMVLIWGIIATITATIFVSLWSHVRRHNAQLVMREGFTGLYNYTGFQLVLQTMVAHALRTGEPLAVLFLDGNGIRKINSAHGHSVGDLVILAISRAMRSVFRLGDVLARRSGDEFLVATPNTSVEGAKVAAMRLAYLLAEHPVESNMGLVTLSASMGIAVLEVKSGRVYIGTQNWDLADARRVESMNELIYTLLEVSNLNMRLAKQEVYSNPSIQSAIRVLGETIHV